MKHLSFTILFFVSFSLLADDFQNDLPIWMETTRVQPVVNTFFPVNRLPVSSGVLYRGNENTEEVFSQGSKALNDLGINATTELAKDNWRPPLWPSAVPSSQGDHPEIPDIRSSLLNKSADVIYKISQNAEANAMRLGVYYWSTAEGRPKNIDTRSTNSKFLYKADAYQWSPPDSWFCKNLDGSLAAVTLPNGTIRGYYLDFTSVPYRKFTLQRFRELAHRGVDNIFFDERHQPNHEDDGCFGGATEAAYIKKYGKSELPHKKDFNNRRYRQFITFQGDKLAETFKYWKSQLQKEFGDERPLFTINGLYLSGFTFPHMSLALADVADSVKVEFRNGIRDFISEGFSLPNIDPVFRSPINIPRPLNDFRTALALVISRDGANGRPFTSWAVEDDFSSEEKALVFHATVLAYGGIVSPNLNYKRMQDIVINKTDNQKFNRNFKSAISLSKKIEPSLAFSRPYKFAAIHLSEAQRKKILTSASIWREIMWPIHSAFEFFIDKGLPVGIITDKQIIRGLLNKYQVVYLTTTSFKKLSPILRAKVKDFQNHGGLVVWKDSQYVAGGVSLRLQALSEAIEAQALISVDYGKGIPENIHPHAVFYSKNKGNTNIVAILNDFTHILLRQGKSKNTKKPQPINGASLILKYKPLSVTDVINQTTLKVKKLDSGKYLVKLPKFQMITLLSIQKSIGDPEPKLDISSRYSTIHSLVTAEVYLNEASCSGKSNIDWGDGLSQVLDTGQRCPMSLRISHKYAKEGRYTIGLSFDHKNKTIYLNKKVDIENISCTIEADKKVAKKGASVKLSWKSLGANTAILSHGAGLVQLSGQYSMKTPMVTSKIEYQLMVYNKNMRQMSSCSVIVKWLG